MNNTQTYETETPYRILKFLLYALLIMPLLLWSIFLFPFITTKVIYFRILVELAAVFYVILALKYPEVRPKWNWLQRGVWIYLAVLFFTSLVGVNFYKSFWSSVERGEGLITILHFVIYFTIISSVFRRNGDWFRYLLFAQIIVLIDALYGLAQLADFSFVIQAGITRISGTIGNAAFYAAFMLFGIFISVYLLLWLRNGFRLRIFNHEFSSKAVRTYLYISLAILLIALYDSQTRGALVALAVTVFLFAAFLVFQARSGRAKLMAGAVVAIVVLSGLGIYLGRNSSIIQNNKTLYRLASISPQDITTQSRFDTWNASWKAWQDRFLTGYGYENYNIAFNKYFPARIFKDQGSQIWFDRAHDIVFDIGVTSGILGLLAYLTIFGIAAVYLLRLYKKARAGEIEMHQYMPLVLLGLLLAYFIQNLFVFDTQATYLMFFLILAAIAAMKGRFLDTNSQATGRVARPEFFSITLLVLAALFVIYFANIEPALANKASTDGIRVAMMKQYRQVKPKFEHALSYGTYMDEEIRQRLIDYSNEAVASGQLSNQEQKDLYEYVISEMKKNIAHSPKDVRNILYLMSVYNRAARFSPQEYPKEVERLGEEAIKLSGTRPQIYFELAQAKFYEKDYDAGINYFRKAVELNDQPKESHFNLLLGGIVAGRDEIVTEELSTITGRLGYRLTAEEYIAIARAYGQVGKKDKSLEFYLKALETNPQSAAMQATVAAAYGELCNVEQAREHVNRATEIDPSYLIDGRKFLAELEKKCQ